MSGTVYALLVGINDYGGNPSPLHGCVADVDALAAILKGRVGEDRLKLQVLLDQNASRQRIVDAFGTHLGQARSGDVAMFAFSGHGSYEFVEGRFWFLEPTGQNQTIVCADSRSKKVGDLADKELNELIKSVSDNGPHVLVVLDCCHSGGGTRDSSEMSADVHVRLAPPVDEPRPVETYLAGVRARVEAAAAARAGPTSASATIVTPAPGLGHPRHVALSACEPTQLSKEIAVDGGFRGAFSIALERALMTMPDTATYRDLMGAAANAVRNRVSDQNPVSFVEGEELDQPFLGGAIRPRPASICLQHERDGWYIDVGSVHGISPPADSATTVLSVLGIVAERGPSEKPIGEVRVVRVEPVRSAVEVVGFVPEQDKRYDAVVTSVPLPPAMVDLRGDVSGVDLVRAALRGSAYVREASSGSDERTRFTVTAADKTFTVGRADGTPITDPVPADQAGAERTARRLEHLASWHRIRDLANPTSALAGQVEIEIVPATKGETPPGPGTRQALVPDETGLIRLSYQRVDERWINPYVFVYLHNRSGRDLYCTLLDLTDGFRSHGRLFPVERISPGVPALAFGGRPIDLTVPKDRIAAGGTQVRDWLKLVASEETFEPGDFDLAPLDGRLPVERGERRRSLVSGLGDRDAMRDAGSFAEAEPIVADWTTTMVTILTERPGDGVAVPDIGVAELADGMVVVAAHGALRGARARLGTTESAARATEARDVAPTAIVRDPSVALPLRLGSARGVTESASDHLELVGDIDVERVSAETPIHLRLSAAVEADDVVLAVARDGDLFIPLGTGVRSAAGVVELDLRRLPAGEPEGESTRGLGRSIRVFFQRIIGSRLGIGPGWPRLSVARVTQAATSCEPVVEYDRDPTKVANALASAQNVLLVVHGLLGDTRTMLPALHDAVGARYDLVLTFDFESIGTSLITNAEALAEQLESVGLSPGSGRQIDVVAVSSGALVVRWFAERRNGATLIRRAVLAGVPNDGSPWAAMQGWATSTLAIGINGLAKIVWPARVLGWLVGAVERLDAGVDDLQPGSAILTELASPSGPAASYTVLAGNSALGDGAEAGVDHGRLGRLLALVGPKAARLAFFGQPNDLISATLSIRHLPEQLDPAPKYVDVPCDHLTYLHHPDAIAAIAEALS